MVYRANFQHVKTAEHTAGQNSYTFERQENLDCANQLRGTDCVQHQQNEVNPHTERERGKPKVETGSEISA
jgi:hypothetical protein